jgi:hypothetical protein
MLKTPVPPELNKRRLTGDVVAFDGRTGKGQLVCVTGAMYGFSGNACLTETDRKLLAQHEKLLLHADFSVTDGPSSGRDVVSEVVVREASGPSSQEASAPSFRGLSALHLEQEEDAMLEVDKLLLIRDDCDDPSLTRHPPMFQVFWEMSDFARSGKQPRTVPVVLVRTRLAMHTAVMSILSEKLSVGMDVVSIDECSAGAAANPQLIVLSVCVGAGVFVFDLPKMHPPERDAVAMLLLSFGAMRPNVPLVTLSVANLRRLSLGYPESFFACTPATVGAVDVLQAAQQVLPQISQKAKTPEELINMVFGYKHAPRPTRSEDAALSIAFGRPAFHSRQVFSQLNNLARNHAFAQLLDKQGRDLAGSRGSVATTAGSSTLDDGSPTNAAAQPATVNAYKRRRLLSWNSSVDSVYSRPSHTIELTAETLPVGLEELVDSDVSTGVGTAEEVQFFHWIQNEIKRKDSQKADC